MPKAPEKLGGSQGLARFAEEFEFLQGMWEALERI